MTNTDAVGRGVIDAVQAVAEHEMEMFGLAGLTRSR